jgi:hypothetical protein
MQSFKDASRLRELAELSGVKYNSLWRIANGTQSLHATVAHLWPIMDAMDDADAMRKDMLKGIVAATPAQRLSPSAA